MTNNSTVIDVTMGTVSGASQGTVESKEGVTHVSVEAASPMTGKECVLISLLIVKHWKTPGCHVTIAGADIGVFSRSQLSEGIHVPLVFGRANKVRDDSLFDHIHAMRTTLSDAWLTSTGHKRPGMSKGLPLDQAIKSAKMEAGEIKLLAKPVLVDINLRPAS